MVALARDLHDPAKVICCPLDEYKTDCYLRLSQDQYKPRKAEAMKILFVDDEAPVLRGIERMLDATNAEWESDFVTSGSAALRRLEEETFDVLVSDMQMPQMDGAELLSRVSDRWPQTVRIVLSGHSSRDTALRAVDPMHQYLSKPCDAKTLQTTVLRACQLRDLLHCDHLQELIGAVHTLPSVPSLYTEVLAEIESPTGTASGVGEVVACDPGMTAKILQIANSAAFGLGRPVISPIQAVSLLGMDIIKSLVLSVGVFRQFDDSQVKGFSIDYMLCHCMKVATLARQIARHQGCTADAVGEAFTAATLHDIGKLILATNAADEWAETQAIVSRERISGIAAERRVLRTDHAAIGAYLLSMWGLPQALVEAIAFHHCPDRNTEHQFTSLSAVSVSNFLVEESAGSMDTDLEESIDRQLRHIGLTSSLKGWRQLSSACNE